MSKQGYIHNTPTLFKDVQPYNFSNTYIQQDFAVGIGHALTLSFEIPQPEPELNFGEE